MPRMDLKSSRKSVLIALIVCAGALLGRHAQTEESKYVFPKFSVEKNPLVISKPNGERFTFLRTGKSTCGKYVLAEVDVPEGAGPPPHIHYASDEWFYSFEGDVTLFVQKDESIFRAGQIPGANVPPVALDALVLPANQLAYGPTGMVHSFKNEQKKTVHRFINLWAPGDGMVEFFKELSAASASAKTGAERDELLMRISAKWGVPHDPKGTFVKEIMRNDPSAHQHNNQAQRLEELIRSTESCNPDANSD